MGGPWGRWWPGRGTSGQGGAGGQRDTVDTGEEGASDCGASDHGASLGPTGIPGDPRGVPSTRAPARPITAGIPARSGRSKGGGSPSLFRPLGPSSRLFPCPILRLALRAAPSFPLSL